MKRTTALAGLVIALFVSAAPVASAATGSGDGCWIGKKTNITWLAIGC